MFALGSCRCPNPSPNNPNGRSAEPFGDESKSLAKLDLNQRTVEITAEGMTNGGVITGTLYVGSGGQRKNFANVLLKAGLATIDEYKISGASPEVLACQEEAKKARRGIWSQEEMHAEVVDTTETEKSAPELVLTVKLSEIRNGTSFFFQTVGDDTMSQVNSRIKDLTDEHSTTPGPVELRTTKLT